MAPSAVPVATSERVTVGRTFGNYKEQAAGAQSYNRKLEEEGDADHPKANVNRKRPVEIAGLMTSGSTSITYPYGILRRSIHL